MDNLLFLIILFIIVILLAVLLFYQPSCESFEKSNIIRFRFYTLQDFTDMNNETFEIPRKFVFKPIPSTQPIKETIDEIYEKDLSDILQKTIPIDKPVAFIKGDVLECHPYPILQKTRPAMDRLDENCRSIIIKVNSERHYGSIKIEPITLGKFLDKKSVILWRGVSTGPGFKTLDPPPATRAYLVKNYFEKYSFLDVGLTKMVQTFNEDYKKYNKSEKTREEHSQYKYILSLQGNDVASNLKWLMGSSSLVFMCKPTVASWFMEDHLIPYHHYVLLKDDFSDLEEKFNWAENNPEKCVEIIKNAQTYVSMFLDKKNEEFLMKSVVQWYKDTVKFIAV